MPRPHASTRSRRAQGSLTEGAPLPTGSPKEPGSDLAAKNSDQELPKRIKFLNARNPASTVSWRRRLTSADLPSPAAPAINIAEPTARAARTSASRAALSSRSRSNRPGLQPPQTPPINPGRASGQPVAFVTPRELPSDRSGAGSDPRSINSSGRAVSSRIRASDRDGHLLEISRRLRDARSVGSKLMTIVIGACVCWLAVPGAAVASGSGATSAGRLASDYVHATSANSRYRAALAVFRSVGVTVVDNRGRAVVRGTANGASDPLLYRAEVKALTARPDLPQDVSWFLAAINTVRAQRAPNMPDVSAADLLQPLRWALRIARAHPADRDALLLRVIDALAEDGHHSVDLVRTRPANMRLDGLQQILLAADLANAARQRTSRLKRSARTAEAGTGGRVCAAVNPTEVVKVVTEYGPKVIKIVSKKYGEVAEKYGKVATGAVKKVLGAASILQWTLVRIGVVERIRPITSGTHMGPRVDGHTGALPVGAPLHFSIQIWSNFPNEGLIRCGPLKKQFPKYGGVPHVGTKWDQLVKKLSDYGTITKADEETDSEGVSNFEFVPNNELVAPPLDTTEKLAQGTVQVTLAVAEAFHNQLVGDQLDFFAPFHEKFDWKVEFHAPPVWLVEVFGGACSSTQPCYDLVGYSCAVPSGSGQDPFDPGATWHWASNYYGHVTTNGLHVGLNSLGPAGTLTVPPPAWSHQVFGLPDDYLGSRDYPVLRVSWTTPVAGPFTGWLRPHELSLKDASAYLPVHPCNA
jgi:hypothetical protein